MRNTNIIDLMNRVQPTLFVDMDGVLATWRSADSFEELLEPGYFKYLEPYQNVVDAIELLSRRGYRICVLSAYMPESQYAVDEKNDWLNDHASFITNRLFCPSPKEKSEMAREFLEQLGCQFDSASFLLDDYSSNLHAWSAVGGTAIKLLNGVNGTKGTWKGENVSRYYSPDSIADQIEHVIIDTVKATETGRIPAKHADNMSDVRYRIVVTHYHGASGIWHSISEKPFDSIDNARTALREMVERETRVVNGTYRCEHPSSDALPATYQLHAPGAEALVYENDPLDPISSYDIFIDGENVRVASMNTVKSDMCPRCEGDVSMGLVMRGWTADGYYQCPHCGANVLANFENEF